MGPAIRFIERYEAPKLDDPMSEIDSAIMLAASTGTSIKDALAFLAWRRGGKP